MSEVVGNTFAGRFLRGLRAGPDRPALHLPGTVLSYAEVHELALQWAGALRAAADGPLTAVAVLAGKGTVGYVGALAAHYTGAAVVPLSPVWPVEQTRRMLTAAGVGVVLADPDGRAKLRDAELNLPVLGPDAGAPRPIGRTDALARPMPAGPGDVAYVLFTSGSTGRPKGIPLLRQNFEHYFGLIDQHYDFHAGDAFAQTMELNFDCAIFDLFCAWGAGACVHPVPAAAYRDLPGFAAARELSVWFSTPSSIAMVRRLGGLRPGGLPGLRWSLFAGEALLTSDATDWQAAAPNATVENIYGPTELTITVTRYRFDATTSPAQDVNGVVPVGTLHAGHRALLVDAGGRPCDGAGELCVAGPQLTPGYLDPEDGQGRFFELDGRRWYRTGDLVRWVAPEVLAFLGRVDSQVQVRGRRVELAEVDDAVRRCPGVQDAVTVARPVGGTVELVVFYTGDPVAPLVLSEHLLQRLPPDVLPRQYHHLAAFPLNENHKIDRRALAAAATGKHGDRRASTTAGDVA